MSFEIPTFAREALRSVQSQKPWIWFGAILVSGFLAFYMDSSSSKASAAGSSEDPANASTLIPAGYVLVPIDVANYESLDSILGNFGVVDLYQPSEDPKKPAHKIAERLKILRAPLNPSHFAVLTREAESARLVSHQGPFTVIVQNPNRAGMGLVKEGDETLESPDSRKHPARGSGRSRITVEAMDGQES
jgi:hypothetical protein